MPVALTNRQITTRIDLRWLGNQARKLLKLLNRPSDELSVLLVDDKEMVCLNGRYRSEERATDVLAFPQYDNEVQSGAVLGDVVISVETALRQLKTSKTQIKSSSENPLWEVEAGSPLGEEVIRLMVHGTLHLLGYDHATDAQFRNMQVEEGRCLQEMFSNEIPIQHKKRKS